MEKIEEERSRLKLSKCYEEDYNIKPYYIERVDDGRYVTWFGCDTNWQLDKMSDIWTKLVDGGFEICEEPVYEKIYHRLKTRI